MILIISCSHHPESRSRLLAQAAERAVKHVGNATHLLDLRTMPLPLCDGHSTHQDPVVKEAIALVKSAEGILLSTPIYNYGANAITKNFIENTGAAWQGKPVGLLCAAGGKGSYMALVPLAGSLMLDFHCHVLPRHVYATGDQFEENHIIDSGLRERIDLIAADICWLSKIFATRVQ
ncbi:MAG: NADPH-dependent FMN reductase [Chthoniobacterales bacterium]